MPFDNFDIEIYILEKKNLAIDYWSWLFKLSNEISVLYEPLKEDKNNYYLEEYCNLLMCMANVMLNNFEDMLNNIQTYFGI